MKWEGGGGVKQTALHQSSTFHNLPSTKSSAFCGTQFVWGWTRCYAGCRGNRLDTQSCLCVGPRGFASSNTYLECSILEEAKLHLCDLETSQGPNSGARRSKQCPPVALWTGNKEANQTRTQKAASVFNWKGGAGGYAPLIGGNTCHFYSGKLNTAFVSIPINSKITIAAKMCWTRTKMEQASTAGTSITASDGGTVGGCELTSRCCWWLVFTEFGSKSFIMPSFG